MKRVKGGTKVLMGQVNTNTYQNQENHLQLFDGKFTTGYRIKSFFMIDRYATSSVGLMATLSTEPKSTISAWDFSDVEQQAWCLMQEPTSAQGPINFIRPDNMIVEDLWLGVYSSEDNRIFNYVIELEKYEFSAWDGAGTMVRNLSQAGPA